MLLPRSLDSMFLCPLLGFKSLTVSNQQKRGRFLAWIRNTHTATFCLRDAIISFQWVVSWTSDSFGIQEDCVDLCSGEARWSDRFHSGLTFWAETPCVLCVNYVVWVTDTSSVYLRKSGEHNSGSKFSCNLQEHCYFQAFTFGCSSQWPTLATIDSSLAIRQAWSVFVM